jgi:hypothetical protein
MPALVGTIFPFGHVLATSNVVATVSSQDIADALDRHGRCDWGDLCNSDRQLNDDSVDFGNRLLSAYKDSNGVTFWIITEADRSSTTVLLPQDY